MAKKGKVTGLTNEEFTKLQGGLRLQLLEALSSIDPKVVGELGLSVEVQAAHFSDWHDRFHDNGGFRDGFGKAGKGPASFNYKFGPGEPDQA